MSSFRKLTLAVAISSTVALAGCVDDDDDNDDGGVVSTGETISGTATAPAGVIGRLETRNLFEIAAEFFISPAAATISGLAPIEDAEVELIRVDDQGNQVGEVLASTTTSTEGVYELTLPQGVNLAGNLVVRINGANQSLRAQVVDHDVDISPVSEFILTKFLETGAHLGQLQLDEVASLSDKVEEFDMTAGPDLDTTFGILETEVGDFVENKVAVVAGGKGDAGSVAGDYRSVSFSLEMSDSDDNQSGSYVHSVGASTYRFADGGEAIVTITLNDEEDIDGSLGGTSINTPPFWLDHETSPSTAVNETFSGTLTQSGILSVESDFEEDFGIDHGEEVLRLPAMVHNLVQAGDNGTFIAQTNEAAVRYQITETDGGAEPVLDTDTKLGDEISRSMEFFARQPTGFEVADLQGAVFGAVFIGSELSKNALRIDTTSSISLETQVNTVTFGDGGTVTVSEVAQGHGHLISQTPAGPEYEPALDGPETVTLDISANGDIESVDGEPAGGFINEAKDFIAIYEGEGQDGDYSSVGLTLMTKLPDTQPSVAGKRFRMQLMSMALDSQDSQGSQPEFLLSSSKFNTFLTMGSETDGTLDGSLDGSLLEVGRTGLAGQLSVDPARLEAVSVDAEIGANGATTLTIDSGDGDTTILDGFFNEDASLGVFALRSLPEGGEPNELGLVVLAAPTPSEE